MYEIVIRTFFSAAHQLNGYNGACEDLHGHNWKVEVTLETDKLSDIGIGLDFKIIKQYVDDNLSGLDHRNLNEIAPFDTMNPSSENIAKWLYQQLSTIEEVKGILSKVTLYETENFSASYYEA